jgi:hypothetical protein
MESAKFVIVSAKGSSAKRWRHRSGRSNGWF